MKIAYIIPAFPDLHKSPSGHLRPYHFLRELSQRHAITLFALTSGEVSSEARTEIGNWAEQVFTFDVTGYDRGMQSSRSRSVRAWRTRQAIRSLKSAFAEVSSRESFDVVLFQGKHTFPVIAGSKLPIVVDFCDATSYRMRQSMRYAGIAELPWRLLRYLEVKHFENKLLKKSQHRVFISGRDRQAILGNRDSSKLVANGIDLTFWSRKTNSPQPNTMVYTGVMEYPPNADGALYLIREILPLIRKSVPDVKLFIVGRNPSSALIEAARQNPEVTVTGFVDDMRPYLEQASVYVAPLRFASGMQNKLLEAMAMEVPVVTTPIGARGIQIEGVEDLPVKVAQGEVEFAQSVIRLMSDDQERRRLAAAGRIYTEQHFDWSRSAAILEQLCIAAAQPVAESGTLSHADMLQDQARPLL